jgi:hypothetical protein
MKSDFQPVVGHKFQFRSEPTPHWNGVTDCEVVVVEALLLLERFRRRGGDRAKDHRHLDPDADKQRHARPDGAIGLPPRAGSQLPRRNLRLAEVHRPPRTSRRRIALTVMASAVMAQFECAPNAVTVRNEKGKGT